MLLEAVSSCIDLPILCLFFGAGLSKCNTRVRLERGCSWISFPVHYEFVHIDKVLWILAKSVEIGI